MTIVNPIVPPPPIGPVVNVTPLTYRDGMTLLEKVEYIQRYVNGFPGVIGQMMQELIDTVNGQLANQTIWVESEIQELTDYVNAQVALIIGDSIEVQDPVVAGMVNNPASETSLALSGKYASIASLDAETEARENAVSGEATARTDADDALQAQIDELAKAGYKNWADWDGTGWINHRNAGEPAYGIPHSFDSIEANIAAGAVIIEADTRWNGGGATAGELNPRGTLWALHDDELTTSTNLLGLVRNTSDLQMKSGRILASKTSGGKYSDAAPITFDEIVERYGKQVFIAVEPKNQTLAQDWEKSMRLMKKIFDSRPGSINAVLIEMSSDTALNNLPIANNIIPGANLSTYILNGSPQMNDLSFANALVALGIKVVGVGTSATVAFLDVFRNSGVKIIGFASRKVDRALLVGNGIAAFRGDYSMYVADAYSRIREDTYRNGFWGVGDITYPGQVRPTLEADGIKITNRRRTAVMLGDFSPMPDSYTIDLELEYVTAGTGPIGMVSLFLNATTDAGLPGDNWTSKPAGYKCGVWVAGGSRIIKCNTGAEVTIASASTPAINPGETYYVRIVMQPTTIEITLRDSAGVIRGTAATANDAEFRGGDFMHLMLQAEDNSVHKIRKIAVV